MRLAALRERLGDFVAALVVRISGVTPRVLPRHLWAIQTIQLFPQILIQNRFLRSGNPAPPFPIVNPLGYPFAHIFAVAGHGDGVSVRHRFQCLEGGLQLHSVVGRVGYVTSELAHPAVCRNQPCGPSSRTWITRTCTVAIDPQQFRSPFVGRTRDRSNITPGQFERQTAPDRLAYRAGDEESDLEINMEGSYLGI